MSEELDINTVIAGDLLELWQPRIVFVRGERGARQLNVGDIVRVTCVTRPNVALELPGGGIAYGCSMHALVKYVPCGDIDGDTTKWAERREV